MKEHHLTVSRTARYFVLGEPGPRLRQLWYVFHGYGQLASAFLQDFVTLADETRLLVAPEALSRFYLGEPHRRVGASWMTREQRLSEIDDYLAYLNEVDRRVRESLGDTAVPVFCLGFSQGAATAARWVCAGTTSVDCLVLWGETLPPEIDEDPAAIARLSSLRLVLVSGTKDMFIDRRRREEQHARIRGLGIPFETVLFEGGHRMDDQTLLRIAGGSMGSRFPSPELHF